MAQDQTTPTPDEVEQQTPSHTPEEPSSDTTPATEEDTSNAPQAEPNDIATPDDGERKSGKPKSKSGKAQPLKLPPMGPRRCPGKSLKRLRHLPPSLVRSFTRISSPSSGSLPMVRLSLTTPMLVTTHVV